MANDVILLFDVKGGVFCGKVRKAGQLYIFDAKSPPVVASL